MKKEVVGHKANNGENYVHSSAGYYDTAKQGIFSVDNIRDAMDIDLSKKV